MLGFSGLIPPQFQAYAAVAKLLLVAAAAVALSVFSYNAGGRHMKLAYEAKMSKAEAAHLMELSEAQAQYIKERDKYEKDTSEVEVEYYNALSEINALKSRPVVINRLYDPGAKKPACDSPKDTLRESAGVSSNRSGYDEGGLSAEAERFLQEEAGRADIEIKKCNLFRVEAHKWAKKRCD